MASDRDVQKNSTNPDAGYPDRLGPSGKFVENSAQLTCLKLPVIVTSTVQCYVFRNFKSGVVERVRRWYIM